MPKNHYKPRRSLRWPIHPEQLEMMRDPESEVARFLPTAYSILFAFHEADIRVTEFGRIEHGIQIGLACGALLDVYTKSGKVVVKGDVYGHSAIGKKIKKALPVPATWSR